MQEYLNKLKIYTPIDGRTRVIDVAAITCIFCMSIKFQCNSSHTHVHCIVFNNCFLLQSTNLFCFQPTQVLPFMELRREKAITERIFYTIYRKIPFKVLYVLTLNFTRLSFLSYLLCTDSVKLSRISVDSWPYRCEKFSLKRLVST